MLEKVIVLVELPKVVVAIGSYVGPAAIYAPAFLKLVVIYLIPYSAMVVPAAKLFA
jgi:hypothetical protein